MTQLWPINRPGECTTPYTTHHISLIYKITGHVAIISSLQASFQQENQRRINHPVPTPTFPIPLHRRSPRRSETATVVNGPGLLQFKSKGATYLKSENGVMRRASCLRHFSFFPMNMAMYWGSTSFQTRPRCVEWPLIAMSVPKHHFSSWLSHLPQNYANQLRASSFCG